MIDVTVLLLNDTFSSTAIGPMEVFRHAGSLWNFLTGVRPSPNFRVTTVSADGRAVNCDGGIRIHPEGAISSIRRTNLIFIPTTGLNLDNLGELYAPVLPGCAAGISEARRSRPSVRELDCWRRPGCSMASAPPHIGDWPKPSARNTQK